ncbi:MAG: hypothetical protein K0R26_796 [Bacteroidota bacterium]|jgi:hypothetical protein|nr:hypothetical protein [Bacteroidota bacterium]
MDKLKRIILQLDQEKYKELEESLIKTHSDKFLTLLRYYRTNSTANLLEILNCNENALYVLKSRLFDKTQKYLIDNHNNSKNSDQKSIENFNQYLTEFPRDTAIAMLHEIEKKYIQLNDPANLTAIYSALKKAYHYSDKQYIYSQLYNKQVAFSISLEKADDLLFSFNKHLANYFFSNASSELDILVLLKNEIKNIHALNKSHKIELILNSILIQMLLFTRVELAEEDPVEDIIQKSETIINQYPEDKQVEQHKLLLAFFKFEYYKSINQIKKCLPYLDLVNAQSQKWLLYGNYCLALKFLFSKVEILVRFGRVKELTEEKHDHYFDNYDFYSTVAFRFYDALKNYYGGQIKEAIAILNKIIEKSSFVNFPHMEFEIKLTLAYFYYRKKEFEVAGNVLKNLSRKVNGSEEFSKYNNVKTFIKLITALLTEKKTPAYLTKQATLLEQFNFYNFSERKVLQHLQHDIETITSLKKN